MRIYDRLVLQALIGDTSQPLIDDAKPIVHEIVASSDEVTNLTVGTAKIKWTMAYDFTLTEVVGMLSTPQSSGSQLTFDIKQNGASIFSTLPRFNNGGYSTITASVTPVLSTTEILRNNVMSLDITQVGTAGARGLKVIFVGRRA